MLYLNNFFFFFFFFFFLLYVEGTKNLLKEHLIDELDYNLVPAEGWQKLVEWYGMVEGQVIVPSFK